MLEIVSRHGKDRPDGAAVRWQIDEDVVPTTDVPYATSAAPWTQPLRPPTNVDAPDSDIAVTPRELAPGTTLRSRYVLEEIIGSGGDSIVFRGRDLHRETPDEQAVGAIAIKVLRAGQLGNAHALTRLKRSFRQMQGLAHVGIARVFDLDHDGNTWFMTMELVAGQSLHSRLQQPITHAEAIRLIGGCCEALEYAHSRGIRHGDLKPANVLVNSDCSVRLIDFGSASSPGIPTDKKWDASLAATPFFASPQVLGGEGADPRDDVFSLACLSYAVFSRGGRPFGDKTTLDAYRDNMRPPLLTDIPPRLFAVIARGLAMERERRPATVHEFLDQLTGSATHACATAGQIFVQQPALPRSQTESTAVQSTVPVATRFTRNGVVPFAHQSKIIPSQPLLLRMDSCVAGEYPVGFTFAVRSKSALSVNGLTAQGRSATRNNPQVPQRYPHPARRSYVLGLTAMVLGMVSLVLRTVQPSAPRPTNAAHSLPTTALPVLVSPAAVNPPSSKVVQTAARKSGFIGFETSAVSAVSAQPLVALQVRRLESTRGSAAIAWQVVGGTAQPNVDYVREAPHVIRFIEGQAVRSIYISLVAHSITTAPRGPRSFAVTLVPVAGSPAIGPYSSVTVTIRPLPPAIDRSAAGESSTLARAAVQ